MKFDITWYNDDGGEIDSVQGIEAEDAPAAVTKLLETQPLESGDTIEFRTSKNTKAADDRAAARGIPEEE